MIEEIRPLLNETPSTSAQAAKKAIASSKKTSSTVPTAKATQASQTDKKATTTIKKVSNKKTLIKGRLAAPAGFKKVPCAIKCALKNHCLNDRLFAQIQLGVEEMSKLVIEGSLYIHFVLSKDRAADIFDKIDYRRYFTHLAKGKYRNQ